MPGRPSPPGQLDIPLIWEPRPADPEGGARERSSRPPAGASGRAGGGRLWLAVLADAGVVVLAVAGGWALAAGLAGGLAPLQLVLAALLGLEVASVVALGCFWGWHGSPGMLLAGLCFSRPIPIGRAFALWLAWLGSLLGLGLPLVLRRRGECLAERLAGGTLSYRSSPGDA